MKLLLGKGQVWTPGRRGEGKGTNRMPDCYGVVGLL